MRKIHSCNSFPLLDAYKPLQVYHRYQLVMTNHITCIRALKSQRLGIGGIGQGVNSGRSAHACVVTSLVLGYQGQGEVACVMGGETSETLYWHIGVCYFMLFLVFLTTGFWFGACNSLICEALNLQISIHISQGTCTPNQNSLVVVVFERKLKQVLGQRPRQ